MQPSVLDEVVADEVGRAAPRGDDRTPLTRSELVAVVGTVVAFVATAVVVLRTRWAAIGDVAMMEMLARDVPGHLPLVGVYSRFGWSHPGPLQLWWSAGFLRTFGPNGLMVGALAWHLAAVLAAWWMARRIARVAGWCVLISMLAVLAAVTAQVGHSPWNPYVSLVGAGTVIVAAWATAERQPWAPTVLVVVGSMLVQAHAATAPLVAFVAVAGLGLAVSTSRQDGGPPVPRRSLDVAVAVGLLLWIGPVLDQVLSDSPNAMLWQMGGEGPQVGLGQAVSTLTRSFAWVPSWLTAAGPGRPLVGSAWAVPVWLVVPIGGAVAAVVRRDRPFVRGSILAGVSMVAAVVSSAMIRGEYHHHLAVIQRPVAAVAMAIGAAALIRNLRWTATSSIAVRRLASVSAAVVVCALAATVCLRQYVEDDREESDPALIGLADDVAARLDVDDTLVFWAPGRPEYWHAPTYGLMAQLEQRGFEVTQLDAQPRTIGAHRVADDGTDGVDIAVVEGPVGDDRAGWEVVATTGGAAPITVVARPRSG
ncbi:hypothetical protein [Dermatobacter hominis]|uniref:hypothetical protein n=1 Tax=Dermatobacter hominis TaxID=2884263 RepID=UPI001D1063ED|nr:hypothetical protein [Dermatobacter hominis]UDY37954.1 hypothetical protein LH044_10505 [Dermatobacter hominis]